ncbi:MAG: T9SS type A sorting domain-containing protein [Flavobacteriales bacterium]
MIKKHILLLASFAFLALQCLSQQEITKELFMSVEQAEQYEKERSFPDREAINYRDNGIELPFIDDFSRFSLPTNDPAIPEEWQLWTDNYARINNSLPDDPPSQGVATLEGLDESGYPYDFTSVNAYGPADTLTSCPIDLSGKTASDSVKLVFHYQSGGFGNEADSQDSLVLEFFIPNSNPPLWVNAWSQPGIVNAPFQREIIHIDNPLFLEANFQFRFRNYATLSGNVDHWHIDYVWLDDNIVDADFSIVDISPNEHITTMLEDYNSMPWEHYILDPASYMKDNEEIRFRNLDEDRNVEFGMTVEYDGAEVFSEEQGINPAAPGFNSFTEPFSFNDGFPWNFSFPTDVSDTCATFDVKYFSSTTPDINLFNDTLRYEQHFDNYYAYDDGSAEGAYALNQANSQIALEYDIAVADSLIGLLIHFNPFTEDNNGELFFLRAWESTTDGPGVPLAENFTSSTPDYYSEGNDVFEFYEYEEPVGIAAGKFFVGISQSTSAELNIGFDKSFDANTSNLFFKLGNNDFWTQSGIVGSLMIRPVFQTNKDLMWDFVDVAEQEAISNILRVYPNPTQGLLSSPAFETGTSVLVTDALGKQIRTIALDGNQIDVSFLEPGMYLIQVLNGSQYIGTSRFIKD